MAQRWNAIVTVPVWQIIINKKHDCRVFQLSRPELSIEISHQSIAMQCNAMQWANNNCSLQIINSKQKWWVFQWTHSSHRALSPTEQFSIVLAEQNQFRDPPTIGPSKSRLHRQKDCLQPWMRGHWLASWHGGNAPGCNLFSNPMMAATDYKQSSKLAGILSDIHLLC